MNAPTVLVTGGTGTLGRLVVDRLRDAGHEVRVLSRRAHGSVPGREFVVGDLGGGSGVAAAVDGVATVVHCAGGARGDDDKARTLVRAASSAGVRHLVYISVVGVDQIPTVSRADRAMFGFYQRKLAAERIVADSGVPYTTLRATQFHELILRVASALTRLPVVPVPQGFRFQPVDAGEVAARLTDLALAAPAGAVPDLGGPRVHDLADLLRSYADAAGRRRPFVTVPVRGAAARAFRAGANLAPEHATGQRTWEQFLTTRFGAARQ